MATIKTKISINGEEQLFENCTNLRISSIYNNHHTFEANIPLTLDTEISFSTIKASLGEYIDIDYYFEDSNFEGGKFRGFVDEIIPNWNPDGSRYLKIKGFSPTIFMDCAPVFRGFTDKSLKDIISTIMKPYKKFNLPTLDQENTNKKIPWSLQVQETDFQALNRLADQNGLAFYYNGSSLRFGNMRKIEGAPIHLEKGVHLKSAALSLNLAPLKFSLNGYDYVQEKTHTAKSGYFGNSNPLIATAVEKNPYPNPNIYVSHTVEGIQSLKTTANQLTAKQAHELITVSGWSFHTGLKIGSIITIDQKDDFMAAELNNRQFVITHIDHFINEEKIYANHFIAVPIDHPYNVRMISTRGVKSGPIPAIVKEINDPKKLGRVKVCFLPDREKSISPWMRVLTPSTDVRMKPKVGDYVLIAHDGTSLEESPFVLGSFFTKNLSTKKWKEGAGILTEKHGIFIDEESGTIKIWADSIEIMSRKNTILESKKKTFINCKKGNIPN